LTIHLFRWGLENRAWVATFEQCFLSNNAAKGVAKKVVVVLDVRYIYCPLLSSESLFKSFIMT
jgi:hypothetical protein